MSNLAMATVTVTTAATRVRFTVAPTPIRRIYIQPDFDNTGSVYVGGSDVSSSVMGRRLLTGNLDPYVIEFGPDKMGDLNELWADASANGNKLYYTAVLA